MTPWSTSEVAYLEEHAPEGAEAVAEALGRSPESVRQQAKRYGVSLRKRWYCPKCGHWSAKPLSVKTGWCAVCTKAERRRYLEQEVRDLEEEVMRERDEDRKRQAIYSKKSRLKKSRKE